ncbi:precorrin-2 dehydrogenase/sirohydrochlorin ferrochelatase family protein [Bacillus sp. KH172YL63]|uniref:precorrin-2 dehydrogenase/sirohydrochlorin ferrochelatase family protein n=1 Tax=Bacillus sp. KH172YL63 TaxID=2709784 RepID=UPI0013E484EA|nr:NAD(P)-dependent oxidoreductase [Bacillus sp. KH172YL63]BCB03804.1 precorrin-2 dehydrogenase [Bacillus sp. KH172YL63]
MLPLMIDVTDKKVTVVGGGRVAYRKLSVFLQHGASVTVVSPRAIIEIEDLYREGRVTWIKREACTEDLLDAFIVIAATDVRQVNEWVKETAGHHQLVCVADQGSEGTLQMTSFHQQGSLTISVSTNGASPLVGKRLCDTFSQQCDEAFVERLNKIGERRRELISSSCSTEEKRRLLRELADKIIG